MTNRMTPADEGIAAARAEASQATANDEFIRSCLKIDKLLQTITALREDHFGADPESVHWGHVGSVSFAVEKLEEITEHFGSTK
jgi:hypothetical protein